MSKSAEEIKEWFDENYKDSEPGNFTCGDVIAIIADWESYASQPEGREDIQCKCSEEDKHGETSIMCCNKCGLPTEKFWQRGPSKQQPAEKDLMQDPFIKKHLNRINLIMGSVKAKRLFVECYPTDIGATHFPNSNFAVKEIFLPDIPPSKEQPEGVEQAAERLYPYKEGREVYSFSVEAVRKAFIAGASWDAGKKDADRLKGLIEKAFDVGWSSGANAVKMNKLTSWTKEWFQFKTDNNL